MLLAIDPGASGGFAWVHDGKVGANKMPQSDSEILDQLSNLVDHSFPEIPVVYIEKVSGFIGKPQPGARMFKFGKGFGFLLGVLMSLRWEINLISPQKWQKSLGIGTKGERSGPEWKRRLKDEAQRLFPAKKVSLATADALLILRFAISQTRI